MPRYDEMDDLLRQVRARLGQEEAPIESPAVEARPTRDAVQQNRQYERVIECTHALLRDAEALRELLGPEHVYTLSAGQHEHIQSVLNSVLQELWSSEVTLRRVRLHD
ncbi:MAG TPA: hypothetical protein VIO57_00580 [Chloroflexota bacterium]|jgi:hypothetical protein